MMSRTISVLVGLLVLSVRPATQIGYLWSSDELRAKSAIVVIATPIQTTETGIKTELRELKPAFPVIELQTEFKVLSILKGDLPQQTFILRHYRVDESRLLGRAGEPKPRAGVIGGAHPLSVSESGSQYLVFLRRDQDQFLIPTSGHVYPADSVFVLRKAG